MPAEKTTSSAGSADAKTPAAAIDLAHLRRQTMDDAKVEKNVLALFLAQARQVRETMGNAPDDERRRLAHRLKGAARGIGAFAVAECAGAVEADPADRRLSLLLAACITEACDFIAALDP